MSHVSVWAVSSGEYSGYSVDLLFTTKKLAQQYADKMNGQEHYLGYRVEEFQLWDEPPPTYTVYQRHGQVRADSVFNQRDSTYQAHGAPSKEEQMSVRGSDGGRVTLEISGPSHYLTVTSTDPKRVEKVWAERVAKIQAEIAGL